VPLTAHPAGGGGSYGGGGGGGGASTDGTSTGGSGAQGIIVITYTSTARLYNPWPQWAPLLAT
jgi:hypothetical protein